jgi:hypothetical protein
VRPRGDQLRVDAGGELREPLGARDRIVERGLSDLGLDEKTKLGSDRGIWPDYRNGGKAGVSASEPRGLHLATLASRAAAGQPRPAGFPARRAEQGARRRAWTCRTHRQSR